MYFEEQVKQKVKERNVKTTIFQNMTTFFSKKKTQKKKEMQRMSCGRDQ